MKIKIEVQMTVKIMYDYLLQHTYTSFSGILGTILGVVCLYLGGKELVLGAYTQTNIALTVLGVMFVFVNPIMLWSKARKQVKRTAMFKKPICYELNEHGIIVSQDDQESSMPWDSVMKVTATGTSVIVYFTRMRAFILPKAALGEDYTNAVKLIFTHVSENRVKIRTVS